MEKQLVTIFVTVYNIEKYLERFFDCLDKQTFRDYKLLMIDDGSTDNSLSICQAHAEQDSRIQVVTIEHSGIATVRNIVLGMLDTEFATSLDGDDYFEPDYLKHLMDAQKKYNADLVISNVITVNQDGVETRRFPPRKEAFFTKEQLPDVLPELLEEDRLNYLYSKLYRTEYLKDIRVEPDVKQGSDTMINIQYAVRINTIAVIEDYDYHYVRYTTRSISSYKGTESFERLYRIQKFLYDVTEQNGLLNDKMLWAIDGRTLLSGTAALYILGQLNIKMKTKLAAAHKAIYSEEYLRSYNRMKEKDQLDTTRFKVIHPGQEDEYVYYIHNINRKRRNRHRKDTILKHTPKIVFKTFHKLKKVLKLIH